MTQFIYDFLFTEGRGITSEHSGSMEVDGDVVPRAGRAADEGRDP
jgi:hypothetical protein